MVTPAAMQAEIAAKAASQERIERREREREEEAAKKFEVQLKEGVCAMDILRQCSITEIGEILGVTPERIAECRVTAKGAIEVTCKTAEECKALLPVVNEAEKVAKALQKENWTGMVINGVPVHWGGDMEKLGKQLAEENSVALAAPPRWLVRPEQQMKNALYQPVVIFVTRTSDRIRLSTKGITLEGIKKTSRLYEQTRDRRSKQCTKCCGYGHQWYQCKQAAKCGVCAGPHSAFHHRCRTKGCVGMKMRGKCEHTEATLKCANCQGKHGALTTPDCPARIEAYRGPNIRVAL